MESSFQEALNAQWDAIESRSREISSVRKHIGKLLVELAVHKSLELKTCENEIDKNKDFIERTEKILQKRAKLEKSLHEVTSGETSKEIVNLDTKIASIDHEIQELLKQKEQLTDRKNNLKSIYSSRVAKFETPLKDINEKYGEDINKMLKLKTTEEQNVTKSVAIKKELDAAVAGEKLWKDVCKLLKSIDHEIRGYDKSQLPQISFILDQGVKQLRNFLKKAQEEKWSFLIIAITHELELLKGTLSIVHEASTEEGF